MKRRSKHVCYNLKAGMPARCSIVWVFVRLGHPCCIYMDN